MCNWYDLIYYPFDISKVDIDIFVEVRFDEKIKFSVIWAKRWYESKKENVKQRPMTKHVPMNAQLIHKTWNIILNGC